MKIKRLVLILGAVLVLLLIPLIAMQFTAEVNWTMFDFVVAGALLLATVFAFEIVLRNVKNINRRVIISLIIFCALVLLWAELAVGIFGTPISGS